MYGYIYLTENCVDGKKYIGQHCASKFDATYLGSGKHLKSAIKKYGRERFVCKMLLSCNSQEELDLAERYYISLYDAVDSNEFYNIALGGKMCQLKYHSEETRKKISNANSGKKRTAKSIKHNSDTHIGARWMHKGTLQSYVLREKIGEFLENGWEFGMGRKRVSPKSSDAKKRAISNALKGKPKSREQVNKQRESLLNKKAHWYSNGTVDMLICEGEDIPAGFERGRTYSEEAREKNRLAHLHKTKIN